MPKSVVRVTMRCKGATRLLRSLVNCAKSGSYRVGTGKSSDRGAEELLSDDPIFLLPVALQHESRPPGAGLGGTTESRALIQDFLFASTSPPTAKREMNRYQCSPQSPSRWVCRRRARPWARCAEEWGVRGRLLPGFA